MLAAVKGVYEKGVVRPLEPIGVTGRVDVIITFLVPSAARHSLARSAGAWKGLDIAITNRSRPRRLGSTGAHAKRVPLGIDEGKGKIHASFFKPLPRDVLDSFYGRTA